MDMNTVLLTLGTQTLVGDFLGELLKFIMYIAIIACAFTIGFKIRKSVDAKKSVKESTSQDEINN